MKVLKVHSHTAIDLLDNLDENFCKKIEELWLNTTNVAKDPELGHGDDDRLMSILAKFKNVKLLHLDPSFAEFDEKHLLSVCRNLGEIKRYVWSSLNSGETSH